MTSKGGKQSCRHRVTGLVEFNEILRKGRSQRKKNELAFFSLCQSHVEVRSCRADTGLVLRLKAGLGTGSGGETCLWEQLGGQLLPSYRGWHVRACQFQCGILSDNCPQQQPVLMLFISPILSWKRRSTADQLDKLSNITKKKSKRAKKNNKYQCSFSSSQHYDVLNRLIMSKWSTGKSSRLS